MSRPNVLFLMSDQHRADVAGFAGNSVVRTPHLDELARSGVVFDNAYTPSPICIPGRQSLMAGQFPRTAKCERFGDDLPPFSLTWAKRLSQWGYRSVCAGKLHHLGADQMQGWTERVAPDAEVWPRYIEGLQNDLPAFAAELGTGKWTNQKEIERAGVAYGPYQRFDERATQAACDVIESHFVGAAYDRPRAPQPLLLKVSLVQPHYPYFTDEEKFAYYLNRVPIFEGQTPFSHPKLGQTQAGPIPQVSPRDIRRATAAYYGMTEAADAHFGTVLRSLENVGQNLDDWLIIYTTDHGEMLGQHAIWEKTQFFEGSARVPLIVRWPRRFGARRVRENVNLCDLFPTLCELCDVPIPEKSETVGGAGLDGESLVSLLSGEAKGWRDETVSQFGAGDVMIRRGALKYCFYERFGGAEVLFDLERDPHETQNFLKEPRYEAKIESLRARRRELGFGRPR